MSFRQMTLAQYWHQEVAAYQAGFLQQLKSRVPAPTDAEAVLRFGAAGSAAPQIGSGGGFNTQKRSNQADLDEQKAAVEDRVELREVGRCWRTVRVYQNGDSDSDNWVDVANIYQINFQAPDGRLYVFNLSNYDSLGA